MSRVVHLIGGNQSPTYTGLILALELIFAAVFAVLFLGEIFTLKDIMGCCIVIIGILIAQIDMKSLSKLKLKT